MSTCAHCNTRIERHWVKPGVAGAVAVELASCDCDRPKCVTVRCANRARPWNSTKCPACSAG